MRSVLVALLCLAAASCGRVGPPQPPFVRVPEPVRDFAASQTAYNVVLSWTNPSHNIDGSPADNLFRAQIGSSAGPTVEQDVSGPGKPQSYVISAKDWVGVKRTFTLRIETNRDKVSSPVSVSIIPVDVPGAVTDLTYLVDQRTIALHWGPPRDNAGVADGYLVQRADRPEATEFVREQSYKDLHYEAGKTYSYTITAARRSGDVWILGVAPQSMVVEAIDRTPPKTPTGLQLSLFPEGAFLSWDANEEIDLAGYRIFRSEGPDVAFHPIGPDPSTGNSFVDREYKPGYRYRVSAVDESKNESPPSVPVD